MKLKLIPAIILAFGLLCLFVRAATTSFVGQLLTVNNTTNNTGAVSFGSFVLFPYGNFTITNAGLTDTNALTIYGQFSMDNTNWLTVATWHPGVTNATNVAWSPTVTPTSCYWRLQIVTTNSVDLSVLGQY